MKNRIARISVSLLLLISTLLFAVGCNGGAELEALNITNKDHIELEVGYTVQLKTDAPDSVKNKLEWAASNTCVTVDGGYVTAKSLGKATVAVSYGSLSDSIVIEVVEDVEVVTTETNVESSSDIPNTSDTERPSIDEAARDAFYGDADPADSYAEAIERSSRGELSGATEVPDQAPTVSAYQPTYGGKLIRNDDAYFVDSNTYVIVNAYGQEVFRVYRGGGYITLEEVAAYVYAFGDIPANYSASKKTSPRESIWGENLRVNHTKFSGSTTKYPYEPKLPNISGCGGTYQYMEIDIGTTGTDCDPSYPAKLYNNGGYIDRGAARIVYAKYDINGNKQLEPDERYVFYTYNHYNDFQEYLNYYGGWGEMFGNITGGGTISSKQNYNPTPYVEVARVSLRPGTRATVVMFFDFRRYDELLYVAA
ncbi:MAG: hypothetical protein IKL59_08255 [Clostridia bacterium]|nr:hypothetical protein [Clostridia bacterium]